MPDAMSASSMEQGPTSGTTRAPAAWARRTSTAPGSATPGQPASDMSPQSFPTNSDASRESTFRESVCSSSTWRRISCSGRGWPIDLRNRRADLAFSAMKVSSLRATASVAVGRAGGALSPPSDTGIRYSVPTIAPGSDKRDAFFPQHCGQFDQRQPDQGAGVVAGHALDQHDTESFDLGAAGAIVGLFKRKIAFDLGIAIVAEAHGRRDFRDLQITVGRIEQGKRGMKQHILAAHRLELGYGIAVIARFADVCAI